MRRASARNTLMSRQKEYAATLRRECFFARQMLPSRLIYAIDARHVSLCHMIYIALYEPGALFLCLRWSRPFPDASRA